MLNQVPDESMPLSVAIDPLTGQMLRLAIGESCNWIPPGGTLSSCAGTLEALPTQLSYYVKQTGPGIVMYQGTLIPTLVPAPSSVLALAGGIATMGGIALRKRKR